MNLNELYTESFFKNPKSPNFVEQLESASEFFKAELPKGVNRKKVLTFISIMYDPASELRKNVSNLAQRKTLAALASGFSLDSGNKFPKEIEDVLVGVDANVARMIAEYCYLSHGLDFIVYTSYNRIFTEVIAMSFKQDKAKDSIALIGKLKSEIEEVERKIFGGDEVLLMRKALYLSSKKMSIGLQMEDIIDRIEKGENLDDLNPYPNNYTTAPLKFVGDAITEE